MENRDVLSQLDSSANAGCRRGLLRRLGSPCIGLRGGAVLSPYPDCSSGHRRHCPRWRRLSQPGGSPKRCSQSLQPDELGRRRLGDVVPDMVCSRRSSENSRSDLPVGPVTMVSEKTDRSAEGGAGSARGVEAVVSAPRRAHRAKQINWRTIRPQPRCHQCEQMARLDQRVDGLTRAEIAYEDHRGYRKADIADRGREGREWEDKRSYTG
jgi:hypothetical protein